MVTVQISGSSASFHIKVHRSISKVLTRHVRYLFRKQLRSNLVRLDFYAMASVSDKQEVNVYKL